MSDRFCFLAEVSGLFLGFLPLGLQLLERCSVGFPLGALFLLGLAKLLQFCCRGAAFCSLCFTVFF